MRGVITFPRAFGSALPLKGWDAALTGGAQSTPWDSRRVFPSKPLARTLLRYRMSNVPRCLYCIAWHVRVAPLLSFASRLYGRQGVGRRASVYSTWRYSGSNGG